MKGYFKEYQTIIESLITQQDTESLAEKRDNTRKRNLRMAGIINDALTRLTGTGVIVTGGLSVEYYTEGNYTTQDIDVITPVAKELPPVLQELGFYKEGKYWVHGQLELILELVATTPFDGTFKMPELFVTEDGYEVKLVNVNDILMDRIKGLVHWKYEDYSRWIVELMTEHEEELDINYLHEQLTEEEWTAFVEHLRIIQGTESFEALRYQAEQFLRDKHLPFSVMSSGDSYAFIFPLKKEAEVAFGPYFGLLLKPYQGILLYNEKEEEFEPYEEDSESEGTFLLRVAALYGEPFTTIAQILRREFHEASGR